MGRHPPLDVVILISNERSAIRGSRRSSAVSCRSGDMRAARRVGRPIAHALSRARRRISAVRSANPASRSAMVGSSASRPPLIF